jgi:hypothetical protein
MVEQRIRERDEIARDIGLFILDAADADRQLTRVISTCAGGFDFARVEPLVANRQASAKLEMLRAVWPAELPDGRHLYKAIRDVHEYRNSLAHSALDAGLVGPDFWNMDAPGWKLRREKDLEATHFDRALHGRRREQLEAIGSFYISALIFGAGRGQLEPRDYDEISEALRSPRLGYPPA